MNRVEGATRRRSSRCEDRESREQKIQSNPEQAFAAALLCETCDLLGGAVAPIIGAIGWAQVKRIGEERDSAPSIILVAELDSNPTSTQGIPLLESSYKALVLQFVFLFVWFSQAT